MNHRSLVFRLGAWYTLLLSATFILVAVATFYGLRHYLRANLRDSLTRRSEPADVTAVEIAREIETRIAPEFNNRFVRVTRSPGNIIYRSGRPSDGSFDSAAVGAIKMTTSAEMGRSVTTMVNDQHLMVSATPVSSISGRYLVELGVSIEPIEAVLERLLDLLALLLPILTVCAAGGGYLLVSWALQPVDRISQTAEQMSL